MMRRHSGFRHRGFVLLEAMLAVAIFALGVLTLGRCVSNCLAAEQFKVEDARARRALENRLAAIEAGVIPATQPLTQKLEGAFAGMQMRQTPATLRKRIGKGPELSGLISVRLEVSWLSGLDRQTKDLTFYVSSHTP